MPAPFENVEESYPQLWYLGACKMWVSRVLVKSELWLTHRLSYLTLLLPSIYIVYIVPLELEGAKLPLYMFLMFLR